MRRPDHPAAAALSGKSRAPSQRRVAQAGLGRLPRPRRTRCSSTRSILLNATAPRATPSSSRIARCSRVCGITPSSAATTSSAKSIPHAPGNHRMHEPFVAGHIDEAEHVAIVERRIGVTELDRDAARLFFLEPIGVDAGQRAHQRRLAVIDMPGGPDDHGRNSLHCAAKAASSDSSRQRRSSHKRFVGDASDHRPRQRAQRRIETIAGCRAFL